MKVNNSYFQYLGSKNLTNSPRDFFQPSISLYSSVRVIASRILYEICLLIGELAIRGTKLTLNARLGTKSNLLIQQLLLGEHYCILINWKLDST